MTHPCGVSLVFIADKDVVGFDVAMQHPALVHRLRTGQAPRFRVLVYRLIAFSVSFKSGPRV